jgi:hypothetical protein
MQRSQVFMSPPNPFGVATKLRKLIFTHLQFRLMLMGSVQTKKGVMSKVSTSCLQYRRLGFRDDDLCEWLTLKISGGQKLKVVVRII